MLKLTITTKMVYIDYKNKFREFQLITIAINSIPINIIIIDVCKFVSKPRAISIP